MNDNSERPYTSEHCRTLLILYDMICGEALHHTCVMGVSMTYGTSSVRYKKSQNKVP